MTLIYNTIYSILKFVIQRKVQPSKITFYSVQLNESRPLSVLGDIAPSELGRTLTHEHLSMQFDVCFVPPERPELADLDWTLGNYGWIWGHPYRDVLQQLKGNE